MARYVCVHGHFYQPPRENPWLEAIELQDSAYPYHDWNERIDAECYAQNGASRILDDEGFITRIVNNYARISFNFGPTLLSWLESESPTTYRAIQDADRLSAERFSGHGSAMAQAYSHMILPLAHPRDRETQVVWGIRDFERRFCRRPEGMWLPETAVDLATLDVLAAHGIRFVVLSPYQAARVRKKDGRAAWQDVSGGSVDSTRPYEQALPSGRSIAIFFYDGAVSQAVAFQRLLDNGDTFARRLVEGAERGSGDASLFHIATDGESYGHHHRHGDMALARGLDLIDSREDVVLTNYGEYLERHPPAHEVEIRENTAWSCAHGLARWKEHCGCASGAHPEWNQHWRKPLRESLDWLRDEITGPYEAAAAPLLGDPWRARNEYIDVILDRDGASEWLRARAGRALSSNEEARALKLLELQRHAMLMYTSCGWFFDDLSGIETVQVIQYAGRVVQLARDVLGRDLEGKFLERLSHARSNVEERGDGASIYRQCVKPAVVDLLSVGAHYAASHLFEDYPEEVSVFAYSVTREEGQTLQAGRLKLAVGRARVRSGVTREEIELSYGALHMGDQNLAGGVRATLGADAYRALVKDVAAAFQRADIPEVVRVLDRHFADRTFSLRSLFRDEQRRVLDWILEANLRDADAAYERIYDYNAPTMLFLASLGAPAPRSLEVAAERAVNRRIERAIEDELDTDVVRRLLREAAERKVRLDEATLSFALQGALERLAGCFAEAPGDADAVAALRAGVAVATEAPFDVDLWHVQNIFYRAVREHRPPPGEADSWRASVEEVGRALRVRVS